MMKSFYPLRNEGCRQDALLFRREDPPVTALTIEQAWARYENCSDFCRCPGSEHALSEQQGTNWMLLPNVQNGYDRIVTAN